VYHEVLIAGDLSEGDLDRIMHSRGVYTVIGYYPTAEFVYGNDAVNTVYFSQPSAPQFVPGGSGPGKIPDFPVMGLKDLPNDTSPLTGKNTPMNKTGAVLRYASPAC